ncbi:hypothetical protein J3D64_004861 [Priestia megaterium]|nr:hypothetical protein [Priestia megaterium]
MQKIIQFQKKLDVIVFFKQSLAYKESFMITYELHF